MLASSTARKPYFKELLHRSVVPFVAAVCVFELVALVTGSDGWALPLGVLTWGLAGFSGYSRKFRNWLSSKIPRKSQKLAEARRTQVKMGWAFNLLSAFPFIISGGEALRFVLHPSNYRPQTDAHIALSDEMPWPKDTRWKENPKVASQVVSPQDLGRVLDSGELPSRLSLGEVGEIAYLIAGKSPADPGKKIWMPHGIPKHSSCLKPLIEGFVKDGYTVYLWDNFGIGQSKSGKNPPQTLAGVAQVDFRVAQELGATDIHVVGHSWFAIRFGELLNQFGNDLGIRSVVSLNASRWPIASTRTQPSDFIEEFLLGHTLGIGRYGSIGHRLGFVLGAPSLLTTMVHQLKDRPDELKAFIARYLKPVRQEADWGGIFIRARKAGEMLTSNNIALAPNHLPKEYFDSRARGLNVLQELPLLFVYGKADVVMVADGLSASQYGRDTWGAICNRHPLSGSLEVDAGHFSYGDLTDSIMDSATKHFERVNASLAQ